MLLYYFHFYKLWILVLLLELIKVFKFPAFLGNDAFMNEADALIIYLLLKISDILTECYIMLEFLHDLTM